MPEMLNLNSENVSWVQEPSSDGFWEYPKDFDSLYADTEE
jgi:hypothetical protein